MVGAPGIGQLGSKYKVSVRLLLDFLMRDTIHYTHLDENTMICGEMEKCRSAESIIRFLIPQMFALKILLKNNEAPKKNKVRRSGDTFPQIPFFSRRPDFLNSLRRSVGPGAK